MNLTKWAFKNSFFVKMLLIYSCIIFFGFIITVYLLTSDLTKQNIDSEAKYEKEIVGKINDFINEKFSETDKIFQQVYYLKDPENGFGSEGLSIVELIKIEGAEREREKEIRILGLMQRMCSSNRFITDMILIDYSDQLKFFYTNEKIRDISINYDFFESEITKNIMNSGIYKEIIPPYIPEYIITSQSNSFSVISVYINLIDLLNTSTEIKLGAVIINLNPNIFNITFKEELMNIKGKIIITDPYGNILFDSKDNYEGKSFNLDGNNLYNEVVTLKSGSDVINYIHSEGTDLTVINITNIAEIKKEAVRVRNKAIYTLIFFMSFSVIIGIFTYKLYNRRIKNLIQHMNLLEKGDFFVPIKVESNDEIGLIEKSFNKMCRTLDEYIKNVYISQINEKSAELKMLQAQINPHFIFNTLESIRMMAMVNKDHETANMVHHLGSMYRWNIKEKEMIILISDEIKYLKSYIALQKIRYQESFDVVIEIDESVLVLGTPKFILQPIIENSIYHGFSNKCFDNTHGVKIGHVIIKCGRYKNTVRFEIADNGNGIPESKLEKLNKGLQENLEEDDIYNIGLINIQQRIRILFGSEYGLHIDSIEGEGTNISLTLPAMDREEMKRFVQSSYS